jgi:hypothetical protein
MFSALLVLLFIASPQPVPSNGKPVIRNDPSHAVYAPAPGVVHSGKPVIRN